MRRLHADGSPLLAQAADGAARDASGTEVDISHSDPSGYPAHTTFDRIEVEVVNLTAAVANQVILSSDTASLGIGGCGRASQTHKVTGLASQTLRLLVYPCAVGSGTVSPAAARGRPGKPGWSGQRAGSNAGPAS